MSAIGDPILKASDLLVQRAQRCLLEGLDCTLHAGEVLGVIGPNGAGKSTLLRVLAGIDTPDAGTCWLQGQALQALAPQQRARQLGYLEQRPRLHWPLQVEDVVALGRLPHADRDATTIARALALTDTLSLRARPFHTLSEGEKVRVNLARLLAAETPVLLADEPVAALDPWYQLQVMELLRKLANDGFAVLLVLHELSLAARFCDRLLLLDQGKVAATGAAAEVLSPANLARVYRIDAALSFDTLTLVVKGRLPRQDDTP